MDYVNIGLICIKIGRIFCVVFGRILLKEFVELLIFSLAAHNLCNAHNYKINMIFIQTATTFLEITLVRN